MLTPPKLAQRFLRLFLRDNIAEEVRGDLDEQFYSNKQKTTSFRAKLNYWYQVFNYLRPFAIKKSKSLNFSHMTMLQHYILIFFRNLFHNKKYALLNIGGLSIGMASAVFLLLWVHDEWSYDRFHMNRDHMYQVVIKNESSPSAALCGALGPALKDEIPEIKDYVRFWSKNPWQLYYNEKNVRQTGTYVDHSVFNNFSFPLIKGNPRTALVDHHSIVLTEKVAVKLFGNDEPLGKMIQIRNRYGEKEAFQVSGVVQDVPRNSHIQFDFLFSYSLLKEWYNPTFAEKWTNHSFTTYVTTQDDISIIELNAKISECYSQHKNISKELFLQPLSAVYLNSDIKNHAGGDIKYVYIFLMIAIFLLLLACINYVNLSTARSVRRGKEVGLRKVMGAGQRQIRLQYFSESILYSFMSLPVTILLMVIFLEPFQNLSGKAIAINITNPLILLGLIIIALITGFISGLYPALYLSAGVPARILRGTKILGKNPYFFRNGLVVFQFSLSIIMMIATLVISTQLSFIQNKNLGFEKENLINTWTSGYNNNTIRNELLKNPQIINVAGSGAQLDWIGWWQTVNDWDGKSEETSVSFGILEVGYEFLDTYGMKLQEGRYYSTAFPSDETEVVVVNGAAIKAMKMESPIGKSIFYNGKMLKIIGVVKDFHFSSLHSQIGPLLFTLYPNQLRCLGIKVKQEDLSNTLSYIEDVISSLEPEYVMEYQFLDDRLITLYANEHQREKLFSYFSFISIFISCLGLFGLSLYSVERRIKEIGIHKILGAPTLEIIILLFSGLIKWILISNLIAWPIAYFVMNKWLQNFAYHIMINVWLFIPAGGVALVISLLTVGWHTTRAALANPVNSLRSE